MKFANGICIITENPRRLAEFYEQVLQIKVDKNDVHIDIPLDGGGITLYGKSAAENDMGFDFSKYHGTGMIKITFFVDNADAEYKRLKALPLDIDFILPPTTYPWGARSMHFRDLDGNIVCFACRQ